MASAQVRQRRCGWCGVSRADTGRCVIGDKLFQEAGAGRHRETFICVPKAANSRWIRISHQANGGGRSEVGTDAQKLVKTCDAVAIVNAGSLRSAPTGIIENQ